MTPPTCRAVMKLSQSCTRLEPFFQAGEKGAARPELRGTDADAGAVANLVDFVEHVEDVETYVERADGRRIDMLRDAEIDLFVRRQGVPVRLIAAGAQAAAGNDVDAETRIPPEIGRPGGRGHELIMIGVDGMGVDEGEIVGIEIELGGNDVLRLLLRKRKVVVQGQTARLIGRRELDAEVPRRA